MDRSERLKLDRNNLYIVLVSLVAFQDSLNSSSLLKPIFEIIKYPLLGMILFLIAYLILTTKDNTKAWFIFAGFILLGINTAMVLSTNAILYIVVLCFLSRNQDIIKGAKAVLIIMGSVFLIHMALFLFNYLFSRGGLQYLDWRGLNRYYIYYDHPNNAAKYFVFICVLIAYLYGEKIKFTHWISILALMMLIYYFTHSEAVFIIVILFCISYFKHFTWVLKGINFVAHYGMAIVSAISACCALFITIPLLSKVVLLLDGMGSGRFSNLFRAVQKYGITFLGQDVAFGNYEIVGGYESIYADNLTVYCMTYLGVIYILTICILFYFSATRLNISGKIYLCMFIIFSFFENRVLGIEAYFAVIIAINSLTTKYKGRTCLGIKRLMI